MVCFGQHRWLYHQWGLWIGNYRKDEIYLSIVVALWKRPGSIHINVCFISTFYQINFVAFICNDMPNTLNRVFFIFIFCTFNYHHCMIFKNNPRQVVSICNWNLISIEIIKKVLNEGSAVINYVIIIVKI